MKKLFLVVLVFAGLNLYADTEVGRIIWELKNFPERKILEIEFSANIPARFAYSKGCINDNLWESYRYGWTQNWGFPFTVTGPADNFTVRIDYSGDKDPDTYPNWYLIRHMTPNSGAKNFPLTMEYILRSFRENGLGTYKSVPGFSWNDEELYWTGLDMSRGYRSFIASYII
jgi:hypothetical protein